MEKEEALKLLFKKAVHSAHPDKGGSNEKFRQVKEAYDFLKNNLNGSNTNGNGIWYNLYVSAQENAKFWKEQYREQRDQEDSSSYMRSRCIDLEHQLAKKEQSWKFQRKRADSNSKKLKEATEEIKELRKKLKEKEYVPKKQKRIKMEKKPVGTSQMLFEFEE